MIPGSTNPLLAFKSVGAGSQYQISRSLRFNSADSANLSRAIVTVGNRKTWTWSGWVKRSAFGALEILFSSGADASNNFRVGFDANNKIFVSDEVATVTTTLRLTTAVYRDPSAWMHIQLAVNTTLATAADRVKLYANGAEVTAFDTSNNPTQNADLNCNKDGTFYIGRNFSTNYLNAYLADVHFISGSALTPSSFGQFDATTGEWVPIAYSGSYGTNGHKLTFSDNSAATAAALGADTSGGGNNFTPNNLSVTAGSGNDSLVDTPTSYGTDTGVGGEVRGNYATFHAAAIGTGVTITDGALRVASTGNGKVLPTIALLGNETTYAECTINTAGASCSFGISTFNVPSIDGSYILKRFDSGQHGGGSLAGSTITGANTFTLTSGDVLGVAYNDSAKVLTFYKNGVSQWSLNISTITAPLFFAYRGDSVNAGNVYANFGQRPWAYAPPSGAKALCDTNLPAPTIVKPSTVMDVVTYTGTGASLTPTSSLGFSPDLVWIKGRSGATDHALYDTVRGTTADLVSNSTAAETTQAQGLTAFNSNGFTVGTLAKLNTNTATYAGWCWDKSVSAGFDIVTYTGNGTNRTIAHSLGVAPSLIIVKQRTTASSTNWAVWHSALANTEYLLLNTTAAKATGATYWNSTSPSSSVFSLGTAADVNTNTGTYVAYCFAPVAGYSAFGSYTGNGNTDGPFVYTGFRPRWILIKSQTSAGWQVYDTARDTFNQANNDLSPSDALAENGNGVSNGIDILSNGFKLRSNDSWMNGSTFGPYSYAAFAESPFAYSRAR